MTKPTNRSELLHARFTVNEAETVREVTEARGIAISAFIREAVLNELRMRELVKPDPEE